METLIKSVLAQIRAGEDSLLEFKEVQFKGNQVRFARSEERAMKTMAEVFVSMANTEGGAVLFGIADDGAILGVEPEKKAFLEQFVINAARDQCLPPLTPVLDWLLLPNAQGQEVLCLKVDVAKSRFAVVQTRDGRYLKRVGSHRMPIPTSDLAQLLIARERLTPFEEWAAAGLTLETLNPLRFELYYKQRFGRSWQDAALSYERLLGNLKLAMRDETETWRPTHLGLLLLADNPEQALDGAYVDLAVYPGDVADGNPVDSKRITGPVPEQIAQIVRYLASSPWLPTRSEKTAEGRRDYPAYDLLALQEGVVNALVHRDYAQTGSQVRLFIFPRRIEIWSPGRLHNSLSPEDLYVGCQPYRRNQLLCGFMRDYVSPVNQLSYMEARGEGFLKLVQRSEALSGKRPELIVRGQAVRLTLFAAETAFGK